MEKENMLELASKLKYERRMFYYIDGATQIPIAIYLPEYILDLRRFEYVAVLFEKLMETEEWKKCMTKQEGAKLIVKYFRENDIWCELKEDEKSLISP